MRKLAHEKYFHTGVDSLDQTYLMHRKLDFFNVFFLNMLRNPEKYNTIYNSVMSRSHALQIFLWCTIIDIKDFLYILHFDDKDKTKILAVRRDGSDLNNVSEFRKITLDSGTESEMI